MASMRTTAIRPREQQRIVYAYQQLLSLVDDPEYRRKYRRKVGTARREVDRLRRRLTARRKKRPLKAA